MATNDIDEHDGSQRDAAATAGPPAGGDSDAAFGQRMQTAEKEAEQYTDVEDDDADSGNARQRRSETAPIPNVVAAFVSGKDDDSSR